MLFLKRKAAEMDLPVQVIEMKEGKPIVVITWQGEEPEALTVMLNSHMDVVPVYPVIIFVQFFSRIINAAKKIEIRNRRDKYGTGRNENDFTRWDSQWVIASMMMISSLNAKALVFNYNIFF